MDLVRETQTREYSWLRYIRQRLRQNKNFMGVIVGPTGSGKTWTGISICEMGDPEFSIDRIVFSGSDLMKLINSGTIKRGSFILWDEAGVGLSARSWQSMANKLLNFLLQTFRHKNFVLLFTTPFEDFLDVATRKILHAELKTHGINFDKQTVKIKGKLYQYNPEMKKFYKKYLRVVTKDGIIPVVSWNVPKPSKKLIDEYEAKRSAFTHRLNKNIEAELRKLEPQEPLEGDITKPLTELQQKIWELIKGGITKQQDIADRLGKVRQQITLNIKFMRKKGYNIPKGTTKKHTKLLRSKP
jgi:biotin operon repressor